MSGPSHRSTAGRLPITWLIAVGLALLVSGCRAPGEDPESTPFRPSKILATTTVEQERLDPPSVKSGRTRLLNGWSPVEGGFGVPAGTTAWLEFAHLGLEPRTLILHLVEETPHGKVSAVAVGRPLTVRHSRPAMLEIEVPGTASPVSSVSITSATDLVVSAVQVPNPRQPGAVSSLSEGRFSQSGWSSYTTAFRDPSSSGHCKWSLQVDVETDSKSTDPRLFVSVPITSSEWQRIEVPPERETSGPALEVLPLAGHLVARFEVEGDNTRALWSPSWHQTCPSSRPAKSPPSSQDSRGPRPRVVLLYVMDALRADTVESQLESGAAGPVLTRLAREGVLFGSHHSVAPNTLPSTKALLVGETWVQQGGWKLPDDGPASLAEHFRGAGYRTALFSNNPYVSSSYGVDRGFEVARTAPRPAEEDHFRDAERLHEAAAAWLSEQDDTAPIFLYLHVLHPHNPYDPPEPFYSEAPTSGSTIDGSTRTLLRLQNLRRAPSPANVEHLRALYEANFSYAAHQFGEFFDWLAQRFGEEALVVALTSDHGEELFDHGGVLHGYTLYEEMTHIPLLVWGPRIRPQRTKDLTSTLDLHATLELLATNGWQPGAGGTLEPLLHRDPDQLHFSSAASVKGGIYSVQGAGAKLIWAPRQGRQWGQGSRRGRSRNVLQHFSLGEDPFESSPRPPEDRPGDSLLLLQLTDWVEQGLSDLRGRETTVSAEVEAALEALGYVDPEN